MRHAPSLLLCTLLAAACDGGSRSTTSTVGDTRTAIEQSADGACPAAPQVTVGSREGGAPCGSASDCRPTCCGCPSSSRRWLAAVCRAGRCAEPAAICSAGASSPATDAEIDAITNGFCR